MSTLLKQPFSDALVTDDYIGPKITVAQKGASAATIVLGPRATGAEVFAANELREYIRKISGVRVPVKEEGEDIKGALILLGTPETNRSIKGLGENLRVEGRLPGEEGFIVKTVEGRLVLMGHDNLGVIYSVYAFLEMLGCRWYGPSDDYEEIPNEDTLIIREIEDLEEPAFERRGIAHVGLWGIKNKLNYLRIPDMGDKVYAWGFKEPSPTLHCFYELLPPSKYFEKHPEWYPLIEGKRTFTERSQLCVSNEEMRQEFAKNLLKAMKDHPHADTWEIYPEDMPFGWCECEQCQALDEKEPIRFDTIREKDRDAIDPRRMTRRYMYFINDIAKRIRKVYPNKKLAMGAYHRYITPPRDLKPEKNVAVSATITQW